MLSETAAFRSGLHPSVCPSVPPTADSCGRQRCAAAKSQSLDCESKPNVVKLTQFQSTRLFSKRSTRCFANVLHTRRFGKRALIRSLTHSLSFVFLCALQLRTCSAVSTRSCIASRATPTSTTFRKDISAESGSVSITMRPPNGYSSRYASEELMDRQRATISETLRGRSGWGHGKGEGKTEPEHHHQQSLRAVWRVIRFVVCFPISKCLCRECPNNLPIAHDRSLSVATCPREPSAK